MGDDRRDSEFKIGGKFRAEIKEWKGRWKFSPKNLKKTGENENEVLDSKFM
jgi:hypothetical protein